MVLVLFRLRLHPQNHITRKFDEFLKQLLQIVCHLLDIVMDMRGVFTKSQVIISVNFPLSTLPDYEPFF